MSNKHLNLSKVNCQKYLDNMKVFVDNPDKNVMYSPISINITLNMFLYLVNKQEYRDEILNFIGNKDYLSYKDINNRVYSIINRIWVNKNSNFQIKDKHIQKYIYKLNMASPLATHKKNKFVAKRTHKFIKSTPTELDNSTIFDVMNIIYFCDKWANKKSIKKDKRVFHNINGTKKSNITFISNISNYYYENDTCYIIPMTYKSGMIFYAIYPKTTIQEVDLTNIFDNRINKKAGITLPEFEIGDGYNLLKILKILGLDLSKMVTGPIQASHVTRIKVNHKGTKAAAVTEIRSLKSIPHNIDRLAINLTYDKPFLYMIGDINNDIAFMGQITNL